jgi:hypothetical protein
MYTRNNNGNAKRPRTTHRGRQYPQRPIQDAHGVSKRDLVPQARKFTAIDTLSIVNATSEFAFGIAQFSAFPTSSNSLGASLVSYQQEFEEYKIRRIKVRAIPGKGMTNDLRIGSLLASRVDTNFVDTASTFANLQSLVNCENTVLKTFASNTNILLADIKPICFQGSTASAPHIPTLPNRDQWYRLRDCLTHVWRAGVAALIIPDNTILPSSVRVTLILEIDVDFRGRVQAASQYTSSTSMAALPRVLKRMIVEDDEEPPAKVHVVSSYQ